ncbi:MAG: peptidase C1 [Bacteroidales bacterium]|nr:peptidase C1 [Bacteroidales bacterium]
MKKVSLIFSSLVTIAVLSTAQVQPDKAIFKESKPGFYQNVIMKDIQQVNEQLAPPQTYKRFKADMTGKDLPNKVDLYKQQWHNAPISQGNAGTCWAFSTVSYFESEVYRLTQQKVKLSEIYIAYWEYVEKVKEFVRTRGKSIVEEGSEANAVTRMIKKYGIVPWEQYNGLIHGRKYHTHEQMKSEMDNYLKWVKEANAWNEEAVVATVKSIMNYHIGEPPTQVNWNGKTMTPQQFASDILKINPDNYVDILSYMQEPFYQKVLYDVPDNWWKSTEYYNVPLDEFMKALNKAVENGYTVAIGGDVSEPGFDPETQCAIIPTFDIPSNFITDEARQFRFSNKTTTDDHGVHLVGYTDYKGSRWYLIKDSGAGSRNNNPTAKEFGYYFFREDYVKLKMMNFTVHKDAVKDLLSKFKTK